MKFTLASVVTLASLASAIPTAKPDPCSVPSGTQVLKCPGFEGCEGFDIYNFGGKLFYYRVVTPGYKSKHALATTINSGGAGQVSDGGLFQSIKTCDGAQYTYSIDYKYNQFSADGGVTVNGYVQYGPENSGTGPTVLLPQSKNVGTKGQGGNGVWASQSAVFTAQDHLGNGTFILQIASTEAKNVTVLVDNISITKN